jgi:hypothetical protein
VRAGRSAFPDAVASSGFMERPVTPYSGGTVPVFHRLPCYALAGTGGDYSIFNEPLHYPRAVGRGKEKSAIGGAREKNRVFPEVFQSSLAKRPNFHAKTGRA